MKSFASVIKNGGVGVLRTDTLYGIVANAFDQSAVQRIYDIKKRDPLKPVIVLISDVADLSKFGISDISTYQSVFDQYWPGPVSIVLPITDESIDTHYLHRGTGAIAFRLPAEPSIRDIIAETGPIVAPSANPEGYSPAKNISEARSYFGDQVDYYLDGGQVTDVRASKIIRVSRSVSVDTIRD